MKAAIFDFDGTLVNSLIFWELYWDAFGKHCLGVEGFVPDADVDKAVRTAISTQLKEVIDKRYGHGEEAYALFNDMLIRFYEQQVELKEGVREFLDHCRENGVKMCVATASETRLVKVAMKRLQLEPYFEGLFSCFDLGVGKEVPDVFFKALSCLGTDKADTFVFEDSLLAIQTVTKAGFKTVGIYDKHNFGHAEMQKIATHYVGAGETMMKLAIFLK